MAAAAKAPREVRTFCGVLHAIGCRISEALALTAQQIDLSGRVVVFESLKKRKRGVFNEAVATWMGAEDGALVNRLLLAKDPAFAAVVEPAAVRRTVTEWRGGRTEHSNLLLALVMLELWMGEYLPRALAPVPSRIAA